MEFRVVWVDQVVWKARCTEIEVISGDEGTPLEGNQVGVFSLRATGPRFNAAFITSPRTSARSSWVIECRIVKIGNYEGVDYTYSGLPSYVTNIARSYAVMLRRKSWSESAGL